MTELEWTDEARPVVTLLRLAAAGGEDRSASFDGMDAKALLDGIAAREAQAAAKALREAANSWQTGRWADDLPPAGASRVQLILGMSQRACGWLRDRADRIERGES